MKKCSIVILSVVIGVSSLFLECNTTRQAYRQADITRDWNEAKEKDTIEAYNYFLSKHPNTKYSDQARLKIEEPTFKKVIRIGNVSSLDYFLETFPQSKYVPIVKGKLDSLLSFRITQIGFLKKLEPNITTEEQFLKEPKPWNSIFPNYGLIGILGKKIDKLAGVTTYFLGWKDLEPGVDFLSPGFLFHSTLSEMASNLAKERTDVVQIDQNFSSDDKVCCKLIFINGLLDSIKWC